MLHAVAVALFTCFVQVGAWVGVLPCLLFCLYVYPIPTLAAMFAYSFSYLDGAEMKAHQRAWPSFTQHSWLVIILRGFYKPVVHAFPEAIDCTAQYIFCFHPHGCMADFRVLIGACVRACATVALRWGPTGMRRAGSCVPSLPVLYEDAEFQQRMHGKMKWLAASVLFRLPVVREITLWTSCCDARRQVASRVLRAGQSIGIVLGGEQEQLRTEYQKEHVYVLSRYGAMRLALRHGVPLVPVYVFGCVDLYRTSKVLYGLRNLLVNKLGVCLPVCWGPFGLPLTPFKVQQHVVVGAPILVEHVEEPTVEQVRAVHQQYVEALQKLFDSRKVEFGYGDRTLSIS